MVNVDWSKAPTDATIWVSHEFGFSWAKEQKLDAGLDMSGPIDGIVICGNDFAPSFGAEKGRMVTIKKPA